ncbi:MAG: hypothetical protein Aurels2KO_14130 [Aureliella sp.]
MAKLSRKIENFSKALSNNCMWMIGGVAPAKQTSTAKDWCRANPEIAQYVSLHPWSAIDYPARPSFGNRDAFEQAIVDNPHVDSTVLLDEVLAARKKPIRHRGVASIEGGRVFSNWGVVIAPDNCLLNDLNSGTLANASDSADKAKYYGRLPPAKKVDGSVGVLASFHAKRNYFHWMIEILPKLGEFRDAQLHPERFFAHYSHSYHRDFLSLMGIEADRIIPAERYSHIQADLLLAPERLIGPMHPNSAETLHQSMADQTWSEIENPSRQRIYVSRERCGARKVTNEAELMRKLKPMGIRRVVLEEMPLKEQIQLFQQVELVVGPHGAGLANVVFSRRSTQLVEFGTPMRPNPSMYHIACARNQPYLFYCATPVGGKKEESDIAVDVDLVSATIADLLDEPIRD